MVFEASLPRGCGRPALLYMELPGNEKGRRIATPFSRKNLP